MALSQGQKEKRTGSGALSRTVHAILLEQRLSNLKIIFAARIPIPCWRWILGKYGEYKNLTLMTPCSSVIDKHSVLCVTRTRQASFEKHTFTSGLTHISISSNQQTAVLVINTLVSNMAA